MVNTELIIDIAKLVSKHGVGSFEDLSKYLKNPANLDSLTEILDNASKFKKRDATSKKTSSSKQKKQVPNSLENLKENDIEKFNFLSQLYQDIVSKKILPTLRDIKFFREDNGLQESTAKSHNEASVSLINDLSKLPMERLTAIEIRQISDEDNSLQGWSDIIQKHKSK